MKDMKFKEVRRSVKGNTYIASGLVLDTSKVGCPSCDTVYLEFSRDGKRDLRLCITPEEALLIANLLIATVDASIYSTGD